MDQSASDNLLDRQEVIDVFFGLLGREPTKETLQRLRYVNDLNRVRLMIQHSDEFAMRLSSNGRIIKYDGFSLEAMLDARVHTEHSMLKARAPWPIPQVTISHKAKVLYCPIGKTGCTFLRQNFIRMSDLPHREGLVSHVHFVIDKLMTGLQFCDYSADETRAFLNDSDYMSFSVIRDPMDRLLSAYIEKFVLGRMSLLNQFHTKTIVQPVYEKTWESAPDFDRGITFREFVDEILSVPVDTLDPHWRPQNLHLIGIDYDEIFAFEHMNNVVDMLSERSGVELPKQPQNVTGSGKGLEVENADHMLPAEIITKGKISKASFFTPDIMVRLAAFVEKDAVLHANALSKAWN